MSNSQLENNQRARSLSFVPHSMEIIRMLINLEEEIINESYTIDTINKIIPIYADLVEYYDKLKDPIKIFFAEKIQLAIGKQKTFDLMKKQKEEDAAQLARSSMSIFSIEEVEEEEVVVNKPRAKTLSSIPQGLSDKRISFHDMKEGRSKKIAHQLKVSETNNNFDSNISEAINNFTNISSSNDKIIKKSLDDQHTCLLKRIEEKRKNKLDLKLFNTSQLILKKNRRFRNLSVSSINTQAVDKKILSKKEFLTDIKAFQNQQNDDNMKLPKNKINVNPFNSSSDFYHQESGEEINDHIAIISDAESSPLQANEFVFTSHTEQYVIAI